MINKFVVSLIMIFILFISSSTAYSLDGDLVYIDDANVYLSSYPHTISSSGWVYFNFTSKVYTGDVDFCLGYDSEVVKPKKHELYNPHWVNWTTNHQAYFHNVSSITTYNGNDFDFGNSYNTYQRQVIYDQCINHNEFECTEYEQTTANCSFDSYTQDGSNYTIYWHTKHSRYELYSRFPYDPSHISYNFQDMTDWYYIQNVPIVQNQNYQMRVWIELPISLTGISSKYFFAIKPSGETIHQSITNGHFYYLDPWYQDSGYAYRKEINITGESGAGTHYQVNFTIGNASGGDFNLSGHSINFPSDVRFADDDGSTALNYWIEDETVDPIIAWVNVTDDLNTSQDIYVYYGKSGASSQSDIDNTFLFADDFPTDSVIDTGRWFDNKYASNPIISPNDGSAGIDDIGTAWGYYMTNGTNDYRMYYTGIQEAGGRDYDICLATSTDRRNWTRITNGIDGTHKVIDDASAWAGPVWKEGTTYHMLYKKVSGGYKWYHVTSVDGISWGSPIQCTGTANTEISSIMKIGSTYHAWGSSPSQSKVYHFTSTDLEAWTVQNSGNAILEISGKNIVCPDIFYNVDDSKYYMVAAVTPYGASSPESFYGDFRLWKADDTDFQTNLVVVGNVLKHDGDTIPYEEDWEDGGSFDGQHFIWPNVQKQINNSDEMYFYYSAEATCDSSYDFSQGLIYFSTVGAAITKAGETPPASGGLDLDKWTKKANANVKVSGGIATLKSNDASSSGIYTKTYNHSVDGVIIEYEGKRGTGTSGTRAVGSMSDVTAMHKGAGGLAYYAASQGVKCWNYAGTSNYPTGTIDNIFYDMKTTLKPDEIVVTGAGLTATIANTLISYPIGVIIVGPADQYIKNFRVRKYNSAEPAFSSAGTEETASTDYIPPNPTNLQNTTGTFWVNYTWQVGSGNVTDYYNVSWNNTWHNDTVNTYMNDSVGASNWANITVWAYNSSGDGTLSAGNVSDEVQAPAADTTFTVTLPGGYSYAKFEPSNSTHKNCTPNGQTDSVPFYNVTNTGTVTLDIRMKLNTTITNIDLKADTDNNPSGSTTITTSLQTIQSNLAVDSSVDIWLWSDFDHAIEQTTNKTLEINVTQ